MYGMTDEQLKHHTAEVLTRHDFRRHRMTYAECFALNLRWVEQLERDEWEERVCEWLQESAQISRLAS